MIATILGLYVSVLIAIIMFDESMVLFFILSVFLPIILLICVSIWKIY